jgi:hypothetical protein
MPERDCDDDPVCILFCLRGLEMAGIRTAAVMNIGTATIAAYVGAGGLDWLIFRGIVSVNTEQIVAGALPVTLLAIGVDFPAGVGGEKIKKGVCSIENNPSPWPSPARGEGK